MNVLELQGVEKRYAGRKSDVVACSGIDLTVAQNEFVALIGPSGCGKSTVLSMVSGLLAPSSGRVLLDGTPVTGPGPDRGVMFQQYALLPWMTVRQNLLFAVESVRGKADAAANAAAVDDVLALVHLTAATDRYPRELSGGMKQRVGLARALLVRPRVLLLDEPFGALDALTRAYLQNEMLDLWERRPMTALMITHDIEEALLLSDRVAMMTRGPGGTIARVIDVPFARPRHRDDVMADPRFAKLAADSLEHLTRELDLARTA
ncbi:MAG: nitrate ABC transporter ATP-binding protein [Vulcanimicrobiaceae bacterium]